MNNIHMRNMIKCSQCNPLCDNVNWPRITLLLMNFVTLDAQTFKPGHNCNTDLCVNGDIVLG
jgi:hypothetical protein